MIDRRMWERLLLEMYDRCTEEDPDPTRAERRSIDKFMEIRGKFWRSHMRLHGPHDPSGCRTCDNLRDVWENE